MKELNDDSLEQARQIIDNCELSRSDATEWLVLHSQLTDPDQRRCAVSPPMLALDFGVAKNIFHSLVHAALEGLSRTHEQAWLAKLVDEGERLQMGIFTEYGPQAVPVEIFILMDRKGLSWEMYDDLYVKGSTGYTEVREMPLPETPKPTVMH